MEGQNVHYIEAIESNVLHVVPQYVRLILYCSEEAVKGDNETTDDPFQGSYPKSDVRWHSVA